MCDIDKYRAQLRGHIGRTVEISEQEFDLARPYFHLHQVPKNGYLIYPTQVCHYESYVVKGLFQSAIIDDQGKKHTLYFPHEDWWVGDYKSFVTGERSDMEIQALETATLLQISRSSLEQLYKEVPVFERFFRILNGKAGIALQDRIMQNLSQNAALKYKDFLKRYPKLRGRLSQKRIASYLGVSPEYFSQMEKE